MDDFRVFRDTRQIIFMESFTPTFLQLLLKIEHLASDTVLQLWDIHECGQYSICAQIPSEVPVIVG